MFDVTGKRVWVAGHRGMVGSALLRRLSTEGVDLQTVPRSELDLRDGAAVRAWVAANRPQIVIVAAAKVGGILANASYPAEFLFDNLMIEANLIHAAMEFEVEKLLFLGSSCIYPKLVGQPIVEESLLAGPIEPTNEAYAIAKIAGIKLTQAYRRQYGCDFISAMPANLYGPNDNFDPQSSHVLPALIHKIHLAKVEKKESVSIWGSGAPLREFLHVDDLADACLHLLRYYSDESPINVGTGEDISIYDLAVLIAKIVGYEGRFSFDASKPDGTQRKLLDVSRLRQMGWVAKTPLREGITSTYSWFRASLDGRRMGGTVRA